LGHPVFWLKEKSKTAVKRFSCFTIVNSVSAVYGLEHPAQTASTDCNWLKQLKCFTAVLPFCFGWQRTA